MLPFFASVAIDTVTTLTEKNRPTIGLPPLQTVKQHSSDFVESELGFLARLLRTLRTVRHLKLSQVYWRVRRSIERKRPPRNIQVPKQLTLRTDTPNVPLFEKLNNQLILEELQHGEITLLGMQNTLGSANVNWRLGIQNHNRLWAVTLHYHGWLWQLAAATRDTLLSHEQRETAFKMLQHYLKDWITRCDLTSGGSRQLAWNAYAISTRIGWWVRLYKLVGKQLKECDAPLHDQFLKSLRRQATYLHNHLERDLRGNHLLRDAVGLAWAGRFFDGEQAKEWLSTANEIAIAEVREQVMTDGGHYERSTMYHLHAMEDICSLACLIEEPVVVEQLRDTWKRMANCLRWLLHPDGAIALLNDAALNGAVAPVEMLNAGSARFDVDTVHERPQGGRHLQHWGLAIWQGDPWQVFFDVGPIGPDHQPGHAHADSLSIECSFRGRRVIVDPGTFAYDHDETRQYDRSTAAHNTVCIDGGDSSEVWHIFRVGRRARVKNVVVHSDVESFRATASHDGYRHLNGSPIHLRSIEVKQNESFDIHDRIEGRGNHHASGSLLLEPNWTVESTDDEGWVVTHGNDRLGIHLSSNAELKLSTVTAPYHPNFGTSIETRRLEWAFDGDLPLEVTTTCTSLS